MLEDSNVPLTSDSSRLRLRTLRSQREPYGLSSSSSASATSIKKPYSRQQVSYTPGSEPRLNRRPLLEDESQVDSVPVTPLANSINKNLDASAIRTGSASRGIFEKVKDIISPWRWFGYDQKITEEVVDSPTEEKSRSETGENGGKIGMKRSVGIATSDEEEDEYPIQKLRRSNQDVSKSHRLDGLKVNGGRTREIPVDSGMSSRYPSTRVPSDLNTMGSSKFHRGAPSPMARRYELLVNHVLQKGDQPLTREEFENFSKLLKENIEDNSATEEPIQKKDKPLYFSTPSRSNIGKVEGTTKATPLASPFQFAPRSAARQQPAPPTPSYYGVGYNMRSTPFKVFPVQSTPGREPSEKLFTPNALKGASNAAPGIAINGQSLDKRTGELNVSVGKSPFASATAKKILETLETMTSPVNSAQKHAPTPTSILKRRQFHARDEKPIKILEDAPPSRPLTLPVEVAIAPPVATRSRRRISSGHVGEAIPIAPESLMLPVQDNRSKREPQKLESISAIMQTKEPKKSEKVESEHVDSFVKIPKSELSAPKSHPIQSESSRPSFTAKHLEDEDNFQEIKESTDKATNNMGGLPVFSFKTSIEKMDHEDVKLTEKVVEQTLPTFQFPSAEQSFQKSTFGPLVNLSDSVATTSQPKIPNVTASSSSYGSIPILPTVSNSAAKNVPELPRTISDFGEGRHWKCSQCLLENQEGSESCKGCKAPKSTVPSSMPWNAKALETTSSLEATSTQTLRKPTTAETPSLFKFPLAASSSSSNLSSEAPRFGGSTPPVLGLPSSFQFGLSKTSGLKEPTTEKLNTSISTATAATQAPLQFTDSSASKPIFGSGMFKPPELKVANGATEPTKVSSGLSSSGSFRFPGTQGLEQKNGFLSSDSGAFSKLDQAISKSKPSETPFTGFSFDRPVPSSGAFSIPETGSELKKISNEPQEKNSIAPELKPLPSLPGSSLTTHATTETKFPATLNTLDVKRSEDVSKPVFTFGAPVSSVSSVSSMPFTFATTPTTTLDNSKPDTQPATTTPAVTASLFTFGGSGTSASHPTASSLNSVAVPAIDTSSKPLFSFAQPTTSQTNFSFSGAQPSFGQDFKMKSENGQSENVVTGSNFMSNVHTPSVVAASAVFTPAKPTSSNSAPVFSFGEKEQTTMATTPVSLDSRSPMDTSMSNSVASGSTAGFSAFKAPSTIPAPVFSFGQSFGGFSASGPTAPAEKDTLLSSNQSTMTSSLPPSGFAFGAPSMPSPFVFGQSATTNPSASSNSNLTTPVPTFSFGMSSQPFNVNPSLGSQGSVTENFQFNVGASDPPGNRKIAKARSRLPRR